MKKVTLIILLQLILNMSCFSQDISQVDIRKFTKQILQIYSHEHKIIMDGYYQMPKNVKLPNVTIKIEKPKDFIQYLSDTTRMELLLSDMPWMMHEISQDFSHRVLIQYLALQKIELKDGTSYSMYYIDSKDHVLLKEMSTPPAKIIALLIPPHLRNKTFSKYIVSGPKSLTQRKGIYGLLDEWTAYYHTSKIALDLKGIYERKSRENIKVWENFFANYYEYNKYYLTFKYYILLHLEYIRANGYATYKRLLADEDFMKAIQMIDQHYLQVTKDFATYKPLIIQKLEKQQEVVKEEVVDGQHILFFNDVGILTNKKLINDLTIEIGKTELQKIKKKFKL